MVGLVIISNPVFAQDNHKQKNKLCITQECFPGPNPMITYKVSGKTFKVLRTQKILKEKFKVTDEIYYCRLNSTENDSLKLIVNKIDLSKFENSYASSVLDGVAWEFSINSSFGAKKISLWNYYLPEFGMLLDFINRQLPKDKRYISFDLFGIRKKFENK